MQEEDALDEEAKFNRLGIREFTYEDFKRTQSEFLDVFQAAYALQCRTKATERVTRAVLRQSQRFVDLLGCERIRKVHESSTEEDLVRLERHMEKTGEDAFGLWGVCAREGCARRSTKWVEQRGRFTRRNQSGWCQNCHDGGEPRYDAIP